MPPSIGMRNKNYLNVKNGDSPWLDAGGRDSGSDDKGHAVFTDPAYGVRAGILLLRVYYFKHNLRTVAEILARWAPATDTIGSLPDGPLNSPQMYSNFVARRMGVGYNDPLEIFNEDKTIRDISRLRDLFYAMAEYENESGFSVPEDEFNAGLELVQPGITDDGTRTSSTRPAPESDPHAGEGLLDLKISASVGRWDKGAVNIQEDVETVQQMLRHASLIMNDPRFDPGDTDGKIAQNAEESDTVRAIEAFQRRLFTGPDGVVDVGGRTWRELVRVLEGGVPEGEDGADRDGARQYFFPLDHVPRTDWNWTESPRSFGANRANGRAHAACDLYAPLGSTVYAITDGTVLDGPYPFYAQTFAIEVDHGEFLARYGEVQGAALVRRGDRVRAGQPIAKVGRLVGITVPSPMLHLELYSKSASGRLTVGAAASARARSGRPFLRRRDLIDPTPRLNEWKHNLPGRQPTPRERAERLDGRIPDSGFCIHLRRLRQERRSSAGHSRTVGEYQCYWNGSALEELKGQMVERQGPGDNTTEVGDNRDLRIREGAYRLAIHNGVNYKTYGYNARGTTYAETPKPGLLLKDTDERSAILIHPGEDYVKSIGCLNPASGLTDAASAIDFMDSRRRVIAIIEAMKANMKARFPTAGTIPEAVILIEGEPD